MEQVVENDEADLNAKFTEHFKELTKANEIENEMMAEKYVEFDNELSSFHPPINSEMVD